MHGNVYSRWTTEISLQRDKSKNLTSGIREGVNYRLLDEGCRMQVVGCIRCRLRVAGCGIQVAYKYRGFMHLGQVKKMKKFRMSCT